MNDVWVMGNYDLCIVDFVNEIIVCFFMLDVVFKIFNIVLLKLLGIC